MGYADRTLGVRRRDWDCYGEGIRKMTSRVSIAGQPSGVADFALLAERLFHDTPLAFQIYGADGRCMLSNAAFQRMFAMNGPGDDDSSADSIGRQLLRDAIERALTGETVRLAIDNDQVCITDTTPSGEGLNNSVELIAFPLWDSDGVVRHVAACYQAIPAPRSRGSEQLRIDDERLKSNERLRRAFEAGRMLAWETNLVSREIHLSENATELLGLLEGHTLDRLDDALALIHPEDRPTLEVALERAAQEGRAHDRRFRVIRPGNAEVRWLEWRAVTSDPSPEGAMVRGVIIDVTDSVEAEEARFMSEARYRTQFEAAPEAIVTFDVDNGCFMEVNEKAEKLFGYSRGQLMKLSPVDVSPEAQPDGRLSADAARAYIAEAMRGERPTFEWLHRDAGGRDFHCEVRLVRLPDPGRNLCRGSIVDITDRKQAEAARCQLEEALRKTEDQLRQSQKMDAIGRLAGGVAHDFNNLLSVVLSYSAFALSALDSDDPIAADVREIQSAGKRAADLTRQLLAFSRQQMLAPAVVDLNEVVRHMDTMLRRLIGEDVDLRTVTDPYIGKVKVDRGQIEQVIMNLAINARDAMPNGGALTIETADIFLDEKYASTHVGIKVGPHVLLSVADSGVGMTTEVQARIFEPFFTTKERGKGTGLGLSTVLGIVEQSGGSISVFSEPGRGATFRIYFPLTDEDPDSTQLATSPRTLHGTETILLVEDEEQLRALGRQILAKSGYHVLVAESVADALTICETYEGIIHLLLTDVVMPQMNGRELAERAASLRPSMKVLYVSGYTDNTIVHHGVLDEGVAFLQKPITPDVLRRKLRDVFDAERRSDAPRR
jgi:two-component system, cell cycle sensor histidine kinase and response regulator CckA